MLSHSLGWLLVALCVSSASAQSSAICAVDDALPAPTGSSCAARGRVLRPRVLATSTSSGLQSDCAETCLRAPACRAFGFNPSNFQCTLYRFPLRVQQFQADATADTWYWDRNCLDSRGSCPSIALPTVTVTRVATSTTTVTAAATTVTLPASTVTVTASSGSSSTSTAVQSTTSSRSSTSSGSTVSSTTGRSSSSATPSATTTTTSSGPKQTFLQVLRDASFEKYTASPGDSAWTFNNGASVVQGEVQDGSSKAQLKANDLVTREFLPGDLDPHKTTYGATMFQDMYTVPGWNYKVTYWLSSADTCTSCILLILQNGQSVQRIEGFDGKKQWTQKNFFFQSQFDLARLEFIFSNPLNGTATASIDNIQIEVFSDQDWENCTIGAPVDLIRNGGFDDASDTTSWTYAAGAYRSLYVPKQNGPGSAVFEVPVYPKLSEPVGPISQRLTGLEPFYPLTLRLWWYLPQGRFNGELHCRLRPQFAGKDLVPHSQSEIRPDMLIPRYDVRATNGNSGYAVGTQQFVLSQLSFIPEETEGVLSFTGECDAEYAERAFLTLDSVSVLKPQVKC